jgi:hypothetical protein
MGTSVSLEPTASNLRIEEVKEDEGNIRSAIWYPHTKLHCVTSQNRIGLNLEP